MVREQRAVSSCRPHDPAPGDTRQLIAPRGRPSNRPPRPGGPCGSSCEARRRRRRTSPRPRTARAPSAASAARPPPATHPLRRAAPALAPASLLAAPSVSGAPGCASGRCPWVALPRSRVQIRAEVGSCGGRYPAPHEKRYGRSVPALHLAHRALRHGGPIRYRGLRARRGPASIAQRLPKRSGQISRALVRRHLLSRPPHARPSAQPHIASSVRRSAWAAVVPGSTVPFLRRSVSGRASRRDASAEARRRASGSRKRVPSGNDARWGVVVLCRLTPQPMNERAGLRTARCSCTEGAVVQGSAGAVR